MCSAASRRPRPRHRREAGDGAREVGPDSAPLPSPQAAFGRAGEERGPRAEREERSHSPGMSVPRLARLRPGPGERDVTTSIGTPGENPRVGRRDEDGDRRTLGVWPRHTRPPGGRANPTGERTPATGAATGPGRHDRTPRACAAGGGEEGHRNARSDRSPRRPPSPTSLSPPHATLGCCRPEGSAAVPRDAWGTRQPARSAARATGDGSRASGGGQEPAKDPRTHALRNPAPAHTRHRRTACPHLSGGTKCRRRAKKLRRPSAGAISPTSAAPSEVASATGPR